MWTFHGKQREFLVDMYGAALTGRLSVMLCNPGRCPGLVGIALSARFVGSKNDEGKERRGWNYLFYCFITSYSTFLVLETAAGGKAIVE